MDTKRHRILAIVCAKKYSIRYPGKNRALMPSVLNSLLKFNSIDQVIVPTDDPSIDTKKYNSDRIKTIKRKKNACLPEESVFTIARWAYYCLDEPYDIVVVILPNVINFKTKTISEGIKLLRSHNLNEVRTYDAGGVENGVIIMKEAWFLHGNLSVYCGAVTSEAKEIHHESEVPHEYYRENQ